MSLWHWKAHGKRAEVSLVNDKYRYQIFNLWPGQYGLLACGPLVVSGYADTLAGAKGKILEHLD